MKDIEKFLNEDHQGHLEHSAEELRAHADHRNELTPEVRRNYFYGISTIFPMMLLSHYYVWLTGKDEKEYMECFVPTNEARYASENRALLAAIYENMDDCTVWASAVSSYMSRYPYAILQAFAEWALSPEQAKKASDFIQADRAVVIPQIVIRLATSRTMDERVSTLLWLGADFPFELLGRFHHAVLGNH